MYGYMVLKLPEIDPQLKAEHQLGFKATSRGNDQSVLRATTYTAARTTAQRFQPLL